VFKRIFWMGTGVAVGASGAFWAKRKVEQTVEQYLPDQVAERAAASARDLGRSVREAAAEGRAAMRATEAELRARVEARTFIGPAAAEPEGGARRSVADDGVGRVAPVARRSGRPSAQAGTGPEGRRRARR
jgi:hypothetical protein